MFYYVEVQNMSQSLSVIIISIIIPLFVLIIFIVSSFRYFLYSSLIFYFACLSSCTIPFFVRYDSILSFLTQIPTPTPRPFSSFPPSCFSSYFSPIFRPSLSWFPPLPFPPLPLIVLFSLLFLILLSSYPVIHSSPSSSFSF